MGGTGVRLRKKSLGRLPKAAHATKRGSYFVGKTEKTIDGSAFRRQWDGQVDLILTSPPFPLNNKKKYGNLKGEKYLAWIKDLAPKFERLLAPKGSLVVEIGNSWEPGRPIQSLLALKALLAFAEAGKLRLIQEFVCYNPSRLPSPAQWVTVNRMRTTDSFTHVWWLAKTDRPVANNARVLRPYSPAMKALLKRGSFNAGTRPSEHKISGSGFLKKHSGAIAHNVFEIDPIDPRRAVRLPNAFSFANSASNGYFESECRAQGVVPHPARMPVGLAAFFIQFLTTPNATVLDPFAGSNTTGFVAEALGRSWIAVDAKREFVKQSKIRFSDPLLTEVANGLGAKPRSSRSVQKK